MAELKSFSELVDEIEALCKARETGYIFITSDKKRSGRILLQNGHIISARYANKQGEQAILIMQGIVRGKVNFHEGHFHENEEVSIGTSTPLLIKTLRGLAQTSEAPADETDKAVELTVEEKEAIEDALVEVLGPMAPLICDEILEDAPNLEAAIEAASLEVNSDRDRAVFLKHVRDRLG